MKKFVEANHYLSNHQLLVSEAFNHPYFQSLHKLLLQLISILIYFLLPSMETSLPSFLEETQSFLLSFVFLHQSVVMALLFYPLLVFELFKLLI